MTKDILPGAMPFTNTSYDAPAYWSAGILWIVNATVHETDGHFSLIDELIPRGPSAPPHIHPLADEGFYIIHGEATFLVAGQTIRAKSGTFLSVPKGTIHSFGIESESCRLLNWYTPGGFEQVIIAMSSEAKKRTLPPGDLLKVDVMSGPPPELEAIVKQYPAAATVYIG